MTNQLKSYLIIIGHLVIGLVILNVFEKLELPWINNSVIMLIAFLLLNMATYYLFHLKQEVNEYWSLRKSPYLLAGIAGGAIIAFLPTLLKLCIGKLQPADFHFNSEVSLTAITLTLVIVAWEELWFRGLFLNYCHKYLSAINLSVTIGFLFMLVHMFNPDINLIKQGPGLFFAGALLTILYFYYKTLWLPIGLHYGNNFFGSRIEAGNSNDILFGADGYVGALVLAVLFFIFVFKIKKAALHSKNPV